MYFLGCFVVFADGFSSLKALKRLYSCFQFSSFYYKSLWDGKKKKTNGRGVDHLNESWNRKRVGDGETISDIKNQTSDSENIEIQNIIHDSLDEYYLGTN